MNMESRTWPEIEIIDPPKLDLEQSAILNLHSLLNILTVLTGELDLLGLILSGRAEALTQSLGFCRNFARCLYKHEEGLANCLSTIDAAAERVKNEIFDLVNNHPNTAGEKSAKDEIDVTLKILEVFRVRVKETMVQREKPGQWQAYTPLELETSIMQMFDAMQAHSRGRFSIDCNQPKGSGKTYTARILFDTDGEAEIFMPPLLVDVMRDLIANARKFTEPGGCIEAWLLQTKNEISFVVSDTGRGIPRAELALVSRFGYRAINTQDKAKNGGGFGLTKAIHVVKGLGGRFWLASLEGTGTRVQFCIPRIRVFNVAANSPTVISGVSPSGVLATDGPYPFSKSPCVLLQTELEKPGAWLRYMAIATETKHEQGTAAFFTGRQSQNPAGAPDRQEADFGGLPEARDSAHAFLPLAEDLL